MAIKRKSILNLDEIVNERQRAVAKVLSNFLHERNMSNKDLAALSGLSPSTIANIFRKEAKSMPGVNALQAIAAGLATDKDGYVDIKKAKALYNEFMMAADYDIASNPFSIHVTQKKRLTATDMKNMVESKVKGFRYPCEISQIVFPADSTHSEINYFDMTIKIFDCPYLGQWSFLFAPNTSSALVYTSRLFYCLFLLGNRVDGKYTVVTNNKEIYDELSTYNFSEHEFCLSVIEVSEDGSMEEKYIKTAYPSLEELDKNGLTF